MEIYVSPTGVEQQVSTPTEKYRLKYAGWTPKPEPTRTVTAEPEPEAEADEPKPETKSTKSKSTEK